MLICRIAALACAVASLLAYPASAGPLLAGASAVRADQPASSGVTHIYSHIDDVRANQTRLCRTTHVAGYENNLLVEERCPAGPRGWPVTMESADLRSHVRFGRQAEGGATAYDALNGAFADPHSVIEWRLLRGKPFAAIHRYYFGAEDRQQALTIHRLNDDWTSCVAAVVSVEHGRDANAEAVRIADEIVPTFRCGRDKLIVVGHIGPPS